MADTGGAVQAASRLERIGRAIPDPILIFMGLWLVFFATGALLGGFQFETAGPDGPVTQTIKPLHHAEHVRWIFDNAVVENWLTFGGGVLGTILLVMMAVGVAEHSGLLGTAIKAAGVRVPGRFLALTVVFLGIMSSAAVDAGYLILVPLAGLLYASVGRHPLAGMAAAFAGVSAGFSANLIPGTPIDVIVGANAQAFAEAQGVPFLSADGRPLNAATMNYWFTAASTFLLAGVGAWVTHRFVEPRLERVPWSKPDDIDLHEFALTADDRRGLRWALGGLVAALLAVALLVIGPLAAHEGPDGDPVVPYLDNVILLISLVFTVTGAAYGFGSRRFTRVFDVVDGMVRQMNTMGYVIVLAFFAYNALALFAYSGLGTLLAHLGATGLIGLGLQNTPMLLLVGFVLLAASVNLLIAGMTSKWLLLGPVFVPMLYSVNPAMTPDLVAAAFRVGDSVTNIITPMMVYAGVILAFARRWVPDFTLGQQIGMMIPYSLAFLASWTLFLMIWFWLGIPLGF